MNQQRRTEILARTASGQLTLEQASALLSVTQRHLRRLLDRFDNEGLASVSHGNTARAPSNKTDSDTCTRVLALAGPDGKYHDFNTSHFCELLCENEQIVIGRSTLDRLLRAEGLRRSKTGRPRSLFRRRERFPREGELLQIDGSSHGWLEDRGPRMCLIGAVDDATGKIVHLRFWLTECLAAYLTLFEEVATTWGLPERFYHDKHTILRSPKQATLDDELAGREPMSQVQKVLKLLGVEGIAAHSPQAKGRVERLWQTLQDRLRKEMRLTNTNSLEEANDFLAGYIVRYNNRFAVPAADPEPAWVKMEPDTDLAYCFASRESRTVKADHTVSWHATTLQIARRNTQASLAGAVVQVHIDPRGAVYLYHDKTRLIYITLASKPAVMKSKAPSSSVSVQTKAANTETQTKPSDNARSRAWLYGSS